MHDLEKADAGARAAGFALLAVIGRPLGGTLSDRVGAAGGLGGFFPPLVMGVVKSATDGYGLGFVLMSLVAVACLVVLSVLRAGEGARVSGESTVAGRS